nr:DUF6538 domain-containing protein [Paracoccus saliphilus]
MNYPAAKLVQVKGKWYVQVTIPPDLRPAFNERKQERRSAGTADRAEAERRLHGLAGQIYAQFDEKGKVWSPLAVAAARLQAVLPGGLNWDPVRWQDEDLREAVDDVRGRAMMILHLAQPGRRDPEEGSAIAHSHAQVRPAYEDFEEKLAEHRSAVKTTGVKLSEAADAYFKSQTFKRERTRLDYERGIKKFLSFAGDVDVASITAQQGSSFAADLGKTASRNTLQRDIGAVRLVLSHAAEQGWVQSNPFVGLRLSNKGKAPVARKSIRRSDLVKLFGLPMPPQDRLCLAILATTGMRLDEAALLEWEDIKVEDGIRYFDLGRVNKIVKNFRSQREVPVPFALNLGSPGRGRLFTYRTDVDGKAQNAASKALMRHVRKIRENSDDVRVTVHSLRHTFKDLLRDAAVPVDVQEFIMGHTGSNEGSRYGSGPSLAVKAGAMNAVDLSFLGMA